MFLSGRLLHSIKISKYVGLSLWSNQCDFHKLRVFFPRILEQNYAVVLQGKDDLPADRCSGMHTWFYHCVLRLKFECEPGHFCQSVIWSIMWENTSCNYKKLAPTFDDQHNNTMYRHTKKIHLDFFWHRVLHQNISFLLLLLIFSCDGRTKPFRIMFFIKDFHSVVVNFISQQFFGWYKIPALLSKFLVTVHLKCGFPK